jgi:hypothetical protein
MTERGAVIEMINTSVKEELNIRNKGTPKTFSDIKWDVIAVCYNEEVKFFDNT